MNSAEEGVAHDTSGISSWRVELLDTFSRVEESFEV